MTTFLFNRAGRPAAFRRTPDDKFLWNIHGHWIGWFPWGDADAVDKSGDYLGTVVNDRLLHRSYFPYPGYGGHAGYAGYLPGFEEVSERLLEG